MTGAVIGPPPGCLNRSALVSSPVAGADDLRQPCQRALRTDGDLQDCLLDRLHQPAVREAGPDLVLSHPPRPPVARLPVAEAQHVVPAVRRDYGAEARHEPGPVVVVEHVKEPAVEDGVELLPQGRQLERVPHEEASPDAPVLRLTLRQTYGLG